MKVYVLTWVSWEECHHHGLWAKLSDAMEEAQRVDNTWDPFPGWDEDASMEGPTRPLAPLAWEELGDDGWGARGCGHAREWRITEEAVR